jgi:hypothetical protein
MANVKKILKQCHAFYENGTDFAEELDASILMTREVECSFPDVKLALLVQVIFLRGEKVKM